MVKTTNPLAILSQKLMIPYVNAPVSLLVPIKSATMPRLVTSIMDPKQPASFLRNFRFYCEVFQKLSTHRKQQLLRKFGKLDNNNHDQPKSKNMFPFPIIRQLNK